MPPRLRHPDPAHERDAPLAAVGDGAPVTGTGEPQELLLFAFGRNAVRIDFDGSDDVIAAVRATKRGL